MGHFYKEDALLLLGSKAAMVNYLKSHYRYFTMNSWNRSTSYANKVKLHCLPLEDFDKAYGIIETDEFNYEVTGILDQFAVSNNYQYLAGFNGRSSGYIVLYRGGRKDSGYKSRCAECMQLNYKTVEETDNNTCGKCGKPERYNLENPLYQVYTQPGRGMDEDDDFEEWDLDNLRDRTKLIIEFDKMCDKILDYLIYCCNNATVEEKTEYIARTSKTLEFY